MKHSCKKLKIRHLTELASGFFFCLKTAFYIPVHEHLPTKTNAARKLSFSSVQK